MGGLQALAQGGVKSRQAWRQVGAMLDQPERLGMISGAEGCQKIRVQFADFIQGGIRPAARTV